ncbi:MAG: DUF4062 domain-containing protein [Rhodobacteraceae bacterium]|nr:DUF4062 domain-containing protein [Paracoccaceae bacterium]
MPTTIHEVSVFISSPSDVNEERKIVESVIEEINQMIGRNLGLRLRPLKWENDVVPVLGRSPQEIIDEDIGDQYDIFLGIMSTRFGTPTKSAASGTQHEFEKAYSRKASDPNSIELMFYFQNPGHSGREIVPSELQKVLDFKESISSKGLYCNYNNTDDFRTHVTSHLAKILGRISDKLQSQPSNHTPKKSQPIVEIDDVTEPDDPLRFLNQLDDDDELGFVELSDEIASAMAAATENMDRLVSSVTKLSDELVQQTRSLEGTTPASQEQAKRTLKAASHAMERFVTTSSSILPSFQSNLFNGLQLSRELLIILSQDNIGTEEERATIFQQFEELKSGMQISLDGFHSMSQAVLDSPRATSEFNRAKKRTNAILQGASSLISSAIEQVESVQEELESGPELSLGDILSAAIHSNEER